MRAQRASENARLQQASFCDEAIVVRVTANPEPENAIWHVHREGAIEGTDARRTKPLDTLEMQRRVLRILLQEREFLVRKCTDLSRQRIMARPERGRGVMDHSVRERPAA